LGRIGCALIAQTAEIAPLDRMLYALRDATATVESIPLIASSIMSKKLAEGIDALVLDVKIGNGAFIADPVRAEELARTMIEIGSSHGCKIVARLTAMDRPLGFAVGNAIEVAESIAALKGGGPPDLREVTLALAAEMLVLGGVAANLEEAALQAAAALDDGRALERFRLIVEAQGGDCRILDEPDLLACAPIRRDVWAGRDGFVSHMDVRAIGHAAVELGAGRGSLDSVIDPAVGFSIAAKPGDRVEAGQPLAAVFARDEQSAAAAAETLRSAITLADESSPPLPLVGRRIADSAEPA
ncbi:MAG TPA: thymidine phosphorylase, partial [Gammaproteobacteria bacterium]|nr:thymidine phosphorylase [Gammaproteobacteria bacterium]